MNNIKRLIKKIPGTVLFVNIIRKIYRKTYNYFRKSKYKNAPFTNIVLMIDTSINEKQYEYVNHNTWYQHGLSIKTYAGFNKKYKLPVSIEHGLHLLDQYPPYEIDNNLPGLFVISEHRKNIYSKYTDKEIISIGPYIHYADSLLTKSKYLKEKKRLGKVLLFMPSHSDVYSIVTHNDYDYLEEVKKISKDFDTVRVCLHWFDVEKCLYKQYQNFGWEIVCAGHETNHLFLSRLKSIIECSDMVIVESVSTSLGYAIHHKKPVMVINPFVFAKITDKGIEDNISQKTIDDTLRNPIIEKAAGLFSNYSDKITNEQLGFVDKYWGLSSTKSKDEMRNIILSFEEKFNKVNKK